MTPSSPSPILDQLITMWRHWSKVFPGKEVKLTALVLHLFRSADPLELVRPVHDEDEKTKWAALIKRAGQWPSCKGVRLARPSTTACNSPAPEYCIATGFEEESISAQLESLSMGDMAMYQLIPEPKESDIGGPSFQWNLPEECSRKISYMNNPSVTQSLQETIDYNQVLLVATAVKLLLERDHQTDSAYALLEMCGQGTYPLGINKHNEMIILCGN